MGRLGVNWFGAVMGLAGLGLACRGAAPIIKQPPAFSELWVFLGAAVFALLLLGLLWRLFSDFTAIAGEFADPARLGYCATLPIAMTLVGGGLQPYLPSLAGGLWWLGVVLLLVFQAFALARWVMGSVPLERVNGGWMIMLVGGIVVPTAGVPLGNLEMSRFCFGASAALAPFVMALVFFRTVAGPAIAEAQRPAWMIFLVPPSLIYANGIALWGPALTPLLEALFYLSVLLCLALLMASWTFLAWPFTPVFWALTFALDAFVVAAAQYARGHPTDPWPQIAIAALLIAVLFVAIAIFRSVRAAFRGEREPGAAR
jgi:tellurite resistance protein